MRYLALSLVLLAVSAKVVNAVLLPDNVKFEVLNDFSNGLYTRDAAHKIPKTASPQLSNVLVDEKIGTVVQRNSYLTVGSTTGIRDGRFSFTFYRDDGTKEFLVSDSSRMLSTKDFQTYVLVSTGLNPNVNIDCTQLLDKAWCTNGSEPVFTWDGTTMRRMDGSNNTPNVPRFRYIDTYQERIWGLNTTDNPGELLFCNRVTTDGVIITPDDPRAWPGINSQSIGAGDGEAGTSLWVFRGQLQIGKERSIWTLFGTQPPYVARRTVSPVGPVSNDTVMIQDGVTKFLGPDGAYAYDGGQALRISDAIMPDMLAANKDPGRIVQNLWDSEASFAKGGMSGTTTTPNGLLTIFTSATVVVDNLDMTNNGQSWVLNSGSTYTPFIPIVATVPPNMKGYFGSPTRSIQVSVVTKRVTNGSCLTVPGTGKLTFYSSATARSYSFNEFGDPNLPNVFGESFFSRGGGITTPEEFYIGSEINASSITVKVEMDSNTACSSGGYYEIKFIQTQSRIHLVPSTTGQFISDVATLTTVTGWGNLDATYASNGGNISFFYRTSTSVVNIATQTWMAITPGVVIDAPTINKYIQWASTTASVSSDSVNASYTDYLTIKHIEGAGSNTRAFATTWLGRYWLAVSTDSDGSRSIIYVQARASHTDPKAWVRFDGINIRSFTKDGESVLYGGAASDGKYYRLDYGTNDDGAPTVAFLTTKQLFLSNAFGDKMLMQYFVDADAQTGGTLTIGTSVNSSAYANLSVALDSTARVVKYLDFTTDNIPDLTGNYFQYRFSNSVLDKPMSFHGFGLAYVEQGTQSDTVNQ